MTEPRNPVEALYREVVLDHYRSPRNRAPLAALDGEATVHNPVCGDQVRVQVALDAEGRVADVSARSRGCSIAVASGSVMTELVRGLSAREVEALHADLRDLVEHERGAEGLDSRIRAFERVRDLPSRRRCATLAWEALEVAFEASLAAVATSGTER